ncbi:MAG: cysteine desulfurase family protein [Bacteriovoracales bacterium]
MEPSFEASTNPVYADYNGSAPPCREVREYVIKRLNGFEFANPNAIHFLGQKTLFAMEKARKICAKILGANPNQVIFNSGSTEGISNIFYSLLMDAKEKGKDTIISSGIEHSAVFNNLKFYEERGFIIKTLPTAPNGVTSTEPIRDWLNTNRVALVSVMAANNETGVIQPFEEIGNLCKEYGAPFFCDTTQYIGKAQFNFNQLPIDFAVLSGHKVGAMTGTGLILAKDPATLKPLIIGGGQEKGIRGGTQNYLGYETLAVALNSMSLDFSGLNNKREIFENKIKESFPEVVIMGSDAKRLPNTTYISYPGIHGQAVQIELESQNIFVSTSSACSDNNPNTSRILKSMGVNESVGRGVIRISLGLCSSPNDYDRVFEGLKNAYSKLSKVKQFI